MALAFRSAGALATVASGNITPALPGTWSQDDIFIAVVVAQDNVTVTFPAGWTKFSELNNGTTLRTTLAWRRAVTGDGNPTITHTAGSSTSAIIVAYSGAITAGTPVEMSAAASANASSTTVTTNNHTPTVPNTLLVFASMPRTNQTSSGYSGTDPTFTEDVDSGAVGFPDIALASGFRTTATAAGARTCTISGATINNGALFGIKPAVSLPGSPSSRRRSHRMVR